MHDNHRDLKALEIMSIATEIVSSSEIRNLKKDKKLINQDMKIVMNKAFKKSDIFLRVLLLTN